MNKKTTFSCIKDYVEQGKHLGEQPVRRMLPACNLNTFSLRSGKPTFPEQPGVTRPLCQDKYYATLHNNNLGIARYALYKITAEDAMKPKVPRPQGDPWQPNQTPGKVTSVTIIIYFCDKKKFRKKLRHFLF